MKLYTRSGDDGSTGLFGGDRVGKDHPRVEAYGCVDEFNATVGLAVSACRDGDGFDERAREMLLVIQSQLFDIGADLATPPSSPHADKIRRVSEASVSQIEGWIDEMEDRNTPLQTFVLPGGCELASRLHLARVVGRRAERRVVGLSRVGETSSTVVHYLNRVSDLLFAMARAANAAAGVDDVPWHPS